MPCNTIEITLPTEVRLVKAMVFPVVMYGCESWTVKKAEHRRIDAFELRCWRRLESPLDCKEIQPVHPKGDQSWVFFGRNDAKAETPILWPPDAKSWLIGKDPDAGRDWGQEEKRTTEDEMAGCHHRLGRHEFEWTLGVGDGQGGLACCGSWGYKESDMTESLNWTDEGSSQIRDRTCVFCLVFVVQSLSHVWLFALVGRFFTTEPPGKPLKYFSFNYRYSVMHPSASVYLFTSYNCLSNTITYEVSRFSLDQLSQ